MLCDKPFIKKNYIEELKNHLKINFVEFCMHT